MENGSSIKTGIQTLSPSYFALVMATGIVSTASRMQHYTAISNVLFWITNIAFAVLLVLYIIRLLFFYSAFAKDLSSHAKGAGFLTPVAGSCILGNGYAQAQEAYGLATALWCFAIALWLVFTFSFLAGVILKKEKPSPEEGLTGIWFLLVVSTQSISILGTTLAPHLAIPVETTLFLSLFAFGLGVMLYLMLVPVIMYRLAFYPMKPEEVVPSYWINMGAAAITTLAGAMLTTSIQAQPVFADFHSFTKATSLLFWAMASFWIPLILLMEIWRYGTKGSALHYSASFWSLVFPLGMYTVSTARLGEILLLSFLGSIAHWFIYLAWLAWLVTFLALCYHLVKLASPSAAGPKV